MNIEIREMLIDDYSDVFSLWEQMSGIDLSSSDSRKKIDSFLKANPGLSLVACDRDLLAGAVLCGEDGRRGYIHHLAVDNAYRRCGVASDLIDLCLARLYDHGIPKCHLSVYGDNDHAIEFWRRTGWTERCELIMMSRFTAE